MNNYVKKCLTLNTKPYSLVQILGVGFLVFNLSNCSKLIPEDNGDISSKIAGLTALEKEKLCPKFIDPNSFNERTYSGQKTGGRISFQEIRASINSACMNCHLAPAESGGFTYEDNFSSLKLNSKKIADALLSEDDSKRMPPSSRRNKNPEAFRQIGKNVQSWINANTPEGEFDLSPNNSPVNISTVSSGELGECVPKTEAVGFNYKKDLWFSKIKKLPTTWVFRY